MPIFRLIVAAIFALSTTLSNAQDLDFFIPEAGEYDTSIPTPEEYLGFPVGKWHLSYEQITGYLKELSKASNRMRMEITGKTYEDRQLTLLTVSSPGNLSDRRLGEIRTQHLDLCEADRSGDLDVAEMPVVIYTGFSVHGNESSGANASVLFAYHLAASTSPEVAEWLDNAVILIDPCMNPDGLNRFAQWANMHGGRVPVGNSDHREHNEGWPNGRTNHYWFDLNRDWLPVQHPESQARIRTFHRWKPNVLTDHHEMTRQTTFFFQPGVPDRTNPLTPAENQELTGKLARHHAKALDAVGQLYYSMEDFDDFYYGKGSTYPDVNGGVGILFEQSSSRGLVRNTGDGPVTFRQGIRNQLQTAMSTVRGSVAHREELLNYQRDFFQRAARGAKQSPYKAFAVHAPSDPARQMQFSEILWRHNIRLYRLDNDLTLDGHTFPKSEAVIIPMEQQQFQLIRALFQQETTFTDSLFYDVSAWTLPLAYNLKYAEVPSGSFSKSLLGQRIQPPFEKPAQIVGGLSNYAYLMPWGQQHAAKTAYALMNNGVRVKVATEPFSIVVSGETKQVDRGTLLIPVPRQPVEPQQLYAMIQELTTNTGLEIWSVKTGLTEEGIDLGSPSIIPLSMPRAALLTGKGVSAYEAGEVWHLLSHRLGMDLVLIDHNRLLNTDLDQFNVLIMADGGYSFNSTKADHIQNWVSNGGTLLLQGGAVRWAKGQSMTRVKTRSRKRPQTGTIEKRPYADANRDRGKHRIGGAILEANLDLTHPLGFGFKEPYVPVLQRGTLFFKSTDGAYSSPVIYTKDPLMAGFVSDENLEVLKESPVGVVTGFGKGRTISFSTDMNFRAFWPGTSRIFLNALFFGEVIANRTAED